MSTIEEFQQVLKESLEKRGVITDIEAKIREELFNLIENTTESKKLPTKEEILINNLIFEYLQYQNYKHTSALFRKETNLDENLLSRRELKTDLKVDDQNLKSLPLIYGLCLRKLNFENDGNNAE